MITEERTVLHVPLRRIRAPHGTSQPAADELADLRQTEAQHPPLAGAQHVADRGIDDLVDATDDRWLIGLVDQRPERIVTVAGGAGTPLRGVATLRTTSSSST